MPRDRPDAPVSFVIAALFAGLALSVPRGGGAWAVGLLLVALLWAVVGVRALRRARRRD